MENYRNSYVTEKRIVSRLSKILHFIVQIEDFIEDYAKISRPYLLYFPRNKPSQTVTVELGRAGPSGAGSSFQMFQLVLKWLHKFISFFPIS